MMQPLRSVVPASRLVRYTALGLIGGGGTATVALAVSSPTTRTLTTSTETNNTTTTSNLQSRWLGLQREIRFWGRVAPVVADYWWHASSSSPYVKYQDWQHQQQQQQQESEKDGHDNDNSNDGNSISNEITNKKNRSNVYKELHDRNAPKIFGIMVDLGGLYVKLGQVLSVTALPVPSQYRDLFKTLQSNVPGHEEFETVIKPTLESELGRPLDEIFESIEEIPVGCASIGQAHRAKLLITSQNATKSDNDEDNNDNETFDVIVKVQYPDARWQVPADIDCVGDFLKLCVYFGVVDESSASMSFDEFSRQFLSELQYKNEAQNLQETYESSLDPSAPYLRRGVVIPKPVKEFCSDRVITMSYLPGPKFEEQARRQLESLGIDTKRGMRAVFEESEAKEASIPTTDDDFVSSSSPPPSNASTKTTASPSSSKSNFVRSVLTSSWSTYLFENIGKFVGVNNMFYLVRLARQVYLHVTATTVRGIEVASNLSMVPTTWSEWAKQHQNAAYQAAMLDWTEDAIDSLFDVHGYQIFDVGLFNAGE